MRLVESKFAAWLRSKPPTEIVGENRDCHACPIALFYKEASGCEVVIFGDGYGDYIIDRGYDKRAVPNWAADFIRTVDGDTGDGKITATRALEALAA